MKENTLYKVVYDKIKLQIESGDLQANDPIPTQIELAKIYEVSEVTVKRALKELSAEGLIVRYRKKGTFVNDQRQSGITPTFLTVHKVYLVHFTNHQSLMHPFWFDMIKGISETCRQHDVSFQLWDASVSYELPEEDHTAFILISNRINVEAFERWKAENRRMINIHMSFPHLNIPYIIVDNYTGGYLATQHLLALNHRRIGIILTKDVQGSLNQEFSFRLQGYNLALSQYRIESDPSLIVEVSGVMELEEMGYEGCLKLLELADRPTAIFATSDHKAYGAIRAIKEHGLRVPEDISVIGYDDLPISQHMRPGLTTVHQNPEKLGARATEMVLFEWTGLDGKGILKDEIVPDLIIRSSTTARAPQEAAE
ncbi:GntR family transcriptional regulator [Paenibacillus nasutitermitis]|uniref:HTH gntR-type domain-containing protein n=1 Tax=Paenibacillus nasutitermitis TaxID=1652958 RepID=A0A916YN78_9BACL|nr:GntR family transcriptional regulator [Paenibacillus nasutitermitis]GGD51134.1 hypothetical protein GCM10010911_05840 [Paenibacillus nasutitermitis]